MNIIKIRVLETPQYRKYSIPKNVPLEATVDNDGNARPLSYPFVLLYPENYLQVIDEDVFEKLLNQ